MRAALWFLLLIVAAAPGCSRSAGSSEAATSPATDPALAADFMRAYTAGYESLDRPAAQARTASRLQGVDRDFALGHTELLRTPLHDVPGFLASGQADALVRERYAAFGLEPDALASANVVLFVSGWEAVNGEAASARRAQGLRRQMAAQAPGVATARTDTARERRILELVAAAITHEARRLEAEGDAAALARFRAGIREDFQRQSGNDLARFDLGEDGFVAR